MNIMHFAGGGDIGGAKTHILSLGKQLSLTDNFHLVSFRPGPFSVEARALGLQVTVVERAWNLLAALRIALKAVDSFQPDVIHCHGAKANMMGVLVKKLRKIPVITTVHSDPALDYMGAPLKQWTFGSINAWALRRMDYYMAVAGKMESSLINRGADPQRIFVIYNGLDFSAADDIPSRAAAGEGDIVVGIAARLTPIKNISGLLQAFNLAYQRNSRLRLKIAGIGEEEAELRGLVRRLHIESRVDFVGWVTDMREFFSGVDINVLSSLSETFPYSLLEGAYEHCAAIASRVGGIPELIEHGQTGFLFAPEDVSTFAEYIYLLSTDHALRRRLAENLYQKAKADFSLGNMHRRQLAAYCTLTKRAALSHTRQGAVICGAYGRGNAGDEAILQAIVAQMREIDADMPLTVMSRNKQDTRQKNRTNAIYIFNVPRFLYHLRHAKIFINGGGSLIQDVTSSRSLYFYLFTLWAARLSGCRVIMYGCGIGPINKQRNRKIAAHVLNRNVETITLRDSISMQVLDSMQVNRPRVLLSADPTVNLPQAEPEQVAAVFVDEGLMPEQPKIGFCLRNWPSFQHPEYIARAADYAYQHYGLLPVFIPIELPRDIDAAAKVTAHMRAPYHACRRRFTVEELIGMLGSMNVVVGMRLHSLIFSTVGGAPVIGVSYDVKVDSFIRDIGSAACIPLSELSADRLMREIDRIAATGYARPQAATARLREKERVNIGSARELLEVSAV